MNRQCKEQLFNCQISCLSKSSLGSIWSYLNNIKQRVKLNNFFTDWHTIISGVSQGSILAPILVNICKKDLILFIQNIYVCNYIDDITLSACGKTFNSIELYSKQRY